MTSPEWIALSLCKYLGGKTLRSLMGHFNHDLQAILQAKAKELRQISGIGPKISEAITQIDLDSIKRSVEYWQGIGVQIIGWDSLDYPRPLLLINDAPPTLFVKGTLPTQSAYAVVGTRTPSDNALALTQSICDKLTEAGYAVVSGMAVGIDTTAHMAALSALNGQTIAVLGSGILNLYPPENCDLAEAITTRGAILCEVGPDTPVSSPGLVARNRIISGLCEGIIIVETSVDGGAMHAARFAQIQEKRLFVVDNEASGNLQLISQGAIALSDNLQELVDYL